MSAQREPEPPRARTPVLEWLAAIGRWPRIAALIGATCIAFSAIFYRFSGVDAYTATFFRCVYGLPILLVIAREERSRFGPMPWSKVVIAGIAGVLLASDLIAYHYSINAIGAGLASVLVNLQVVFVVLVAWVLLHERPTVESLLGVPVVLTGVVLISGVLDHAAYGPDPVLGGTLGILAAAFLAGYLLLIRQGGRDLNVVAGPVAVSTLTAAVFAGGAGIVAKEFNPLPTWPAHFWLMLLGVTSQSTGYLLLSVSLPRLPAALTSLVLVTQGVTALALAAALLGEAPSALQVAGVSLVVVGLMVVVVPVRDLLRGRGYAVVRPE